PSLSLPPEEKPHRKIASLPRDGGIWRWLMAIRSSCVPWRSTSGDRSYAWPVAGEDLTGRANGVPEEPGDYWRLRTARTPVVPSICSEIRSPYEYH
uniref:Uncharacterized protein n=1 Tax=Aegilops tauschii subsp. strangulata TaxID=200361 RepID=A0A453DDU1_AEGTS